MAKYRVRSTRNTTEKKMSELVSFTDEGAVPRDLDTLAGILSSIADVRGFQSAARDIAKHLGLAHLHLGRELRNGKDPSSAFIFRPVHTCLQKP